MRFLSLFALFSMPGLVFGRADSSLKALEKRYRKAHSVQMDVDKTVRVKLLERVTASKGKISIAAGGKFRWDTLSPDRNLVLISGKRIWMVDYPSQEGEAVRVLKAKNVKKTKPHALVAFLLGQGRLSSNYRVSAEEDSSGKAKLNLTPKTMDDQVKSVVITLTKDKKQIEKIMFEDTMGSSTELLFSNVKFDQKLDKKLFEFVPPKGATVTDLD